MSADGDCLAFLLPFLCGALEPVQKAGQSLVMRLFLQDLHQLNDNQIHFPVFLYVHFIS
jgi:hypothetical protein